MKIRSNFVSNSSSSSFILEATGETSSIRKVARLMIKSVIKNSSYSDESDYYSNVNLNEIDDVDDFLKARDEFLDKRELDLKEKEEWLLKLEELDENQPIFFPSCNYDTWIARTTNNILVCTCNNESWELPNRVRLSEESKEELFENAKGDPEKIDRVERIIDDPYDFYGLSGLFDNFYSLPWKIIGTAHPSMSCTNPKHKWIDMWKINGGGTICPVCLSERRDKLKQIEKSSE